MQHFGCCGALLYYGELGSNRYQFPGLVRQLYLVVEAMICIVRVSAVRIVGHERPRIIINL